MAARINDGGAPLQIITKIQKTKKMKERKWASLQVVLDRALEHRQEGKAELAGCL